MALKPLPRLILIVAALGGAAVAYFKFSGAPAPTMNASAPTITQAVDMSMPAKPAAQVAGSGNAMDRIATNGELVVSVQTPSLPFFSIEGGQARGFNVDFLKLLLQQEGFAGVTKTKFAGVDTYEGVPKQLLQGEKVDIAIDGLTFSDNEPAGVTYTIPYVEDFGYALIGNRAANVRPDLSGAVIGVLKGDPDVKAFVSSVYPKAQVVELSDASTNDNRTWIKDAIDGGKVDAVIYDYPFAVAEISNTSLQFLVSKLPGSDIQYKIGLRQADQPLKDALNRAIRKVKASPEYGDLIRKYFMSTNTAVVKSVGGGETTYTVKKGDTLSLIAGAQLGSNMRYTEIEARNNLANPNLISVGQKLVIPKR